MGFPSPSTHWSRPFSSPGAPFLLLPSSDVFSCGNPLFPAPLFPVRRNGSLIWVLLRKQLPIELNSLHLVVPLTVSEPVPRRGGLLGTVVGSL